MSSLDRDAFIGPRRARWDRLERLILHASTAGEWAELAAAYRAVCADLARARSAGVAADVQHYLDELSGRAHNQLYGSRRVASTGLIAEVFGAFPRELRAQWRYFLLASLLFYGPFAVGGLGSALDPSFAALVLPPDQLAQVESMYSEGGISRGVDGDASMAGFYVLNNVGIAFRCFATGALGGLGSIFYLIYNGLMIGTVAGYLTGLGLGGNLLEFIAGHAAWELTGVCVAGAAGLKLGWALLVTEGRTRRGSLAAAGPSLVRLVLGTTLLLLVAAAIEGFWSAGPAPRNVKYVFGAVQWAIVGAWFLFGGRR